MKTSARYYGLLVLLLVGTSIPWFYRGAYTYTLDPVAAWMQYLSNRVPFTLVGLYGLAPTLNLWGTGPPIAGERLCGSILCLLLILMGTTLGALGLCLTVRYVAGVWRLSRYLEFWQRPSSQEATSNNSAGSIAA